VRALRESDGYATAVSDETMDTFGYFFEKEEGLSVFPASVASVAAIAECVKTRTSLKNKCYVSVLTSGKY
jgi:threonine synthase